MVVATAWRCVGKFRGRTCGRKLAETRGAGTVIACPRCGTVNRA